MTATFNVFNVNSACLHKLLNVEPCTVRNYYLIGLLKIRVTDRQEVELKRLLDIKLWYYALIPNVSSPRESRSYNYMSHGAHAILLLLYEFF